MKAELEKITRKKSRVKDGWTEFRGRGKYCRSLSVHLYCKYSFRIAIDRNASMYERVHVYMYVYLDYEAD